MQPTSILIAQVGLGVDISALAGFFLCAGLALVIPVFGLLALISTHVHPRRLVEGLVLGLIGLILCAGITITWIVREYPRHWTYYAPIVGMIISGIAVIRAAVLLRWRRTPAK